MVSFCSTNFDQRSFVLIRDKIVEASIELPDDLAYKIVCCLREALEDDVSSFLASSNLVTHNGLRSLKGDFIHTRLQTELGSKQIEVVPLCRSGWKSRLVIDREHKRVYSVISEGRMKQVAKEAMHRNVPHYALLFAYNLNSKVRAPHKQMSMFDEYPFSDEIMTKGFDKLVGGILNTNENYQYCVITYEVIDRELSDCQVIILDRDLDVAAKKSLNRYITPEYSALTSQHSSIKGSDSSVPRVKLKKRESNITTPLVSLKEEEKQA